MVFTKKQYVAPSAQPLYIYESFLPSAQAFACCAPQMKRVWHVCVTTGLLVRMEYRYMAQLLDEWLLPFPPKIMHTHATVNVITLHLVGVQSIALSVSVCLLTYLHNKLSYHRGTARRAMLVNSTYGSYTSFKQQKWPSRSLAMVQFDRPHTISY